IPTVFCAERQGSYLHSGTRVGGRCLASALARTETEQALLIWADSQGKGDLQDASPQSGAIVVTDVPARLDRLPWGPFHSLVVVALGITWVLDGLEVTLAGAVAPALKESPLLHFTNAEVGIASSGYLAGAVLGALFFGWLTDRLGRKRLFFITLAVYLVATAATALSWNLWSFSLFRVLTGAGIGGEYTAINSSIQELDRKSTRLNSS